MNIDANFVNRFAELKQKRNESEVDVLASLWKDHPTLAGLPWILGDDCSLTPSQAKSLHFFVQYIRNTAPYYFNVTEKSDAVLNGVRKEELQTLVKKVLGKQPISMAKENQSTYTLQKDRLILGAALTLAESSDGSKPILDFRSPEAIPALRQLLLSDDAPTSLLLVGALAKIDGPEATRELAKSAVFNLDSMARALAIDELRNRNEEDYRNELLRGLKYPLNPIVNNAAEAITRLGHPSFVKDIDDLLEGESPSFPFVRDTTDGPIEMVREVVQIHHHSNCRLCHEGAPVQRTTPFPPLVSAIPDDKTKYRIVSYREARANPNSTILFASAYYDTRPQPKAFVDASITYLRPDFSVSQNITVIRKGASDDSEANEKATAHLNRFDYLVRVRPAEKSDFTTYARENSKEYFDILRYARYQLAKNH